MTKLKHNTQYINGPLGLSWRTWASVWMVAFVTVALIPLVRPTTISPCPREGCVSIKYVIPKTVDSMVDTYSMKYGKTAWTKLRTKSILHYLLLREAAYGNTTTCGDGGLACGPLQFHEATYIAYRNIMIDRGLVTDIGSRMDMEDSIETTAWAINDGRENAWGPIARGEIKI